MKNATLTEEILSKDPMLNAGIRTVITPTIITGGEKSNIIPVIATATFNVQIHSGDTVQSVLEHVKNTINDTRIEIRTMDYFAQEASPLPSTKHPSYDILANLTKVVFGDNVPLIPFLSFGGTDSKYFQNIGYGEAFYRFNPVNLDRSEIQGIHGYNERVSVDSYEKYVKFMILFIKESNNLT